MNKKILDSLNVDRTLLLVLTGLCSLTLLINSVKALYFLSDRMEFLSEKMIFVLVEDLILNSLVLLLYVIFILSITNYF